MSLPPTFWEMCRAQIFEVIVVVVGLTAWGIARRWRPKTTVVVPPEIRARRELAALRGRAEDGALAVEVSRVLRQYCSSALKLSPGELTTSEVRQALAACPWVTPEMAAEVDAFLRRCDERKFSPTPPQSPLNAVETALKLVERLDGRRRETQLSGTSQPPPLVGAKS